MIQSTILEPQWPTVAESGSKDESVSDMVRDNEVRLDADIGDMRLWSYQDSSRFGLQILGMQDEILTSIVEWSRVVVRESTQ